MVRCFFLVLCLNLVVVLPTLAEDRKGLDITFVDTEGGAATLVVTPAGESILFDCGNPGARDADRIYAAAKQAGLKAIDHLVITHWHLDHYGSIARLSKLIPIKNYHDRGIPATLAEDPTNFPLLIQAYRAASEGKSKTLKAGDEIKLRAREGTPAPRLLCLCGNTETIADKPGAAENPLARDTSRCPRTNRTTPGAWVSCSATATSALSTWAI